LKLHPRINTENIIRSTIIKTENEKKPL